MMPIRSDMRTLSASKATNPNATAVRLALLIEMYEAVQDGDTHTDAVSTGSMVEGEIIALIAEMQSNGFLVTLGTATITVDWA